MIDLLLSYMPGLSLTLVRVSAMIAATGLIGRMGETRWPRILLIVSLSIVLFLRAPEQQPVIAPGVIGLGIVAAREAIIGLALGFAVDIVFSVLRLTGTLLGMEMGFGMAQIVDPSTGIPSQIIARFFEALSFLFLLSVDGHHHVFRILAETFDRVPVGSHFDLEALVEGLILLSSEGIQLAVRIASPIYLAVILVTVTLLVLSRAVPQVNLMEFGFPLRILIAMLALLWFMTTGGPYVFEVFGRVFSGIESTFAAIGGPR